jgi:hypothetical protein
MPDLPRDPLAVVHAPVDRIDAAIAKLGMVVADIDYDDAARHVRKQPPRKIGDGLLRNGQDDDSPALAASTTETGVAPISAANVIRLPGPLEFAIEWRMTPSK